MNNGGPTPPNASLQDTPKHPIPVGGFGLSSDTSDSHDITEDEIYYCDLVVILV
jgi:hypothetical protein